MMASVDVSLHDELRIVLFGKIGAGKSSLANRILGSASFKREETGLCVKRQGEHGGKKLTVVDTPGWDRVSVRHTPEKTKQEIVQSVSLNLPGPHALLVVLPVNTHGNPPSANEMKSVSHHIELLSKRAWRYTMVVFVCDKDETKNDSVLDQHLKVSKRLLDKCSGRYFVLHEDSQISDLLQTIEEMVRENCGDFLIPQMYHEVYERRMPSGVVEQAQMFEKREEELKQIYRRRINEKEEEIQRLEEELKDRTLQRQRSGSSEFLPPNFAETNPADPAVISMQTVRRGYHEEIMEIIKYYMKSTAVVLAGMVGALIGAVVGATEGVQGSSNGIWKGCVIGIQLAVFCIVGTRLVRHGIGGFLSAVRNFLPFGEGNNTEGVKRQDSREHKLKSPTHGK